MDGESGNLMVTVPAGIEKHLVLPVLLGIQYVVAACMPHKKNRERACSERELVHEPITSWEKKSRKGLTG